MVSFPPCRARQLPGSFNTRNTPPSRRVNLESRLAGRGPVAGREARQGGAHWSEEAKGNFRECPHSRVPSSCIRRPRGPVAPPAGGSAAYTAVSLVGGGLGAGVGEGTNRVPSCPGEGSGRFRNQDSILWLCPGFPPLLSVGSHTSGLETERASREGAFRRPSSLFRDPPENLIVKLEAPGKVHF